MQEKNATNRSNCKSEKFEISDMTEIEFLMRFYSTETEFLAVVVRFGQIALSSIYMTETTKNSHIHRERIKYD